MDFIRETKETDGKRYVMVEYKNAQGDIKEFDNRKRTGIRGRVPRTHPEDATYNVLYKIITYMPKDIKVAYSESDIATMTPTEARKAREAQAKAAAKEVEKEAKKAVKEQERETKKADKAAAKLRKEQAKSTGTVDTSEMDRFYHITDLQMISQLSVGAMLSLPNSTFKDDASAFKFRVDAVFAGVTDGKVYCFVDLNGKNTRVVNKHGFFVPKDGKYKVKALSAK